MNDASHKCDYECCSLVAYWELLPRLYWGPQMSTANACSPVALLWTTTSCLWDYYLMIMELLPRIYGTTTSCLWDYYLMIMELLPRVYGTTTSCLWDYYLMFIKNFMISVL